jgi:hypothetical protein
MAMFGLFKKKEKPVEKKSPAAGSEELRALAAKFLPEERTILAVTGPSGCTSGKQDGDELYTVGIVLTAWMDDETGVVTQGEFRLVTKADETLQQFIGQHLPRNFIVKCKVRPHPEGTGFLLTNLPEPAFDPELKAILEAQKAPVTVDGGAIGTFVLNRGMKLFQCEVDWAEDSMVLCFDEKADPDASIAALSAVLARQEEWDTQARSRCADLLLDKANEFAAEEGEPLTREEFMQRLVPDSLELLEGDNFHIWYGDDGMLCGTSVEVACSPAHGVTGVEAEV